MKITIFLFLIIFCGSEALAELPFQGKWFGAGEAIENGTFKPIEVTLNVKGPKVTGDTHFNGFSALTYNIFLKDSTNTFRWLDINSHQVGFGMCAAESCTFVGHLKVDDEVYTLTKTYSGTGSQLYVAETTTGTKYSFIVNLVLNKVEEN